MDDPDGISHRTVMSRGKIVIRHEEVSVLDPPMEPIIVANSQLSLIVITEVLQSPQGLKTPMMQ